MAFSTTSTIPFLKINRSARSVAARAVDRISGLQGETPFQVQ
jgi:hypothetical protein